MIVDGKNLIAGRLASKVAKAALKGEEVFIINTEMVAISGPKVRVMKKFLQLRRRGDPHHGPYYPRVPKDIFKRIIRGMLPYKQGKGREAFARIKCYHGIPENLKDKDIIKYDDISIKKLPTGKYLTLKQVAKELGVKE